MATTAGICAAGWLRSDGVMTEMAAMVVNSGQEGRRVLRPRAGNPIQISPAAYNQAQSIPIHDAAKTMGISRW
ncbi:hypothetical protein [Streptomyces sp. NPDC053048]|uniref:hypothetical protein n=1 Tax=Streptomyces sp. NPDC053048 TaxID=3365694 RepID=UPI0037D598F5